MSKKSRENTCPDKKIKSCIKKVGMLQKDKNCKDFESQRIETVVQSEKNLTSKFSVSKE